jgi:hypothetical protein
MNKETWNEFLVIRQDGAGPLVRIKPVVLRNGASKIKVIDNSGVDLSFLQKPSSRRVCSQCNAVVMLHTPLPTAERG